MVPTGMLPDQEADRLKGIWVLTTTASVRKVTTWHHRGHERGQVEGWGLKARPDKDWNTFISSGLGRQKVLSFLSFQAEEVPRNPGSRL